MKSGYFKTSYVKDRRELFPNFIDKAAVALSVVALMAVAVWSDQYTLYVWVLSGIAVVGATGLNLTLGVSGQVSLGHAALIAVGAYVTALSSAWVPALPFPVVFAVSGLAASFVGVLIALPTFRLRGLYLAVATLSLHFIIIFVLLKARRITGGAEGLLVGSPSLGGSFEATERSFFPIVVVTAILGVAAAQNLLRTKAGRAWQAIRDRELVAEAMGVDLRYYKGLAFAVGGFYAGVCGSMYAFFIGYVSPGDFSLTVAVAYIVMVVLGGKGSVAGPVVGAITVTWLPHALNQGIRLGSTAYSDVQVASILPYVEPTVFGLALIMVLLVEPDGGIGIWRNVRRYFVEWPFR